MDLTNAGLLERAWRVMGYDAIWDDYKAIRDAVRAEQREADVKIAESAHGAGSHMRHNQVITAAIRAQGETR